MRRGRILIYLALILILGVAAAYVLGRQYLLPQATPPPVSDIPPTPIVETVDVVVVAQRIPRGTLIDETLLGKVPIQRNLLLEGYITDVNQVVGRRSKFDLDAGILLTNSMLAESASELSTTGSDAAIQIPRGMVAVSIPISRLSSISYAPQRGDHVNVIVTMLFLDLDSEFQTSLQNNVAAVIAPGSGGVLVGGEAEDAVANLSTSDQIQTVSAQSVSGSTTSPQGRGEFDPTLEQTFYIVPSEKQRPRLVSQTLIQDVMVLQIGDFPTAEEEVEPTPVPVEGAEPTPVPEGAQIPTPEPEVKPPDVITLIVSPQDAVALNYLIYSGAQLTLALRPTGDDTRIQTEAVTLQFLMEQYDIPVPVKLPYGLTPRIDEIVAPVLANDQAQPTPKP